MERLEATLDPDTEACRAGREPRAPRRATQPSPQRAPSRPPRKARDRAPAAQAGGVLAIFLCPAEAQRLAIPSCMQYALTPDASCRLVAAHEQLVLALSTLGDAHEGEPPPAPKC